MSATLRGASITSQGCCWRKAQPFTGTRTPCTRRASVCAAACPDAATTSDATRRQLLGGAALAAMAVIANAQPQPAAAALDSKVLCEADCVSALESKEMVTLPSGLQYRDIVVGTGPAPIKGYQVVCNYVAMTPNGRVFDSSLDKGVPYDIRVGAGQVIPGLDEGLLSMKVGGTRRLYIPGDLAFPKPLKAAAGRPSVPANSPVVFDVQLLYIPGLETDDE